MYALNVYSLFILMILGQDKPSQKQQRNPDECLR